VLLEGVIRSALNPAYNDPARFAFHKLWISGRRSVSEQTKALKDLRQAGDLFSGCLRSFERL